MDTGSSRDVYKRQIPTCLQMHFVTPSLSPVKTFTDTPFSLRALIADNVDSFGGSKKARYPIKTILDSSATEKDVYKRQEQNHILDEAQPLNKCF